MSRQPCCREDFEVGIICALPHEYNAVVLLFDKLWNKNGGDIFGRSAGDTNNYTTGRIGKHDVVLALLSHIGKATAAAAAASMRSSYRALRLVILAGVCGGVPYTGQQEEILLGDVLISKAIVQYDFGRHYPDGFSRKDTYQDNLSKPDRNVRNLLAIFETDSGRENLQERTAFFLEQLQDKAGYGYPGAAEDKLFMAHYRHKHHNSVTCICSNCHGRTDPVCEEALALSCDELGCDEEYLVVRKRLRRREKDHEDIAQKPAIYIGTIASGDTVMKSGEDRDEIAKREGVIGFEMEGAGVWEEIPCIVVKGVCDYADCHKNKMWQNFAAATASSALKAILEQYTQADRVRGRFMEGSPKCHFLVPFGRNQNFVGRETYLSQLLERIRPESNEDDCQITAIEGLGGVGKTQIALEAAYLVYNEQSDCSCSVFWVPAVDGTSFENAYRDIGKKMMVQGINEDKADVKQLVKDALSNSNDSWLLIIDNADDTSLLFGINGLSDYLPFSRKGSIFFTTRNHEASVRLNAGSIICIQEMDDGEALGLLKQGLKEGQTSDMEGTKRLLDFLANLPLAIRQASAYMATKSVATSEYLELCESEHSDMINLLSKDFEDRHRYKGVQNNPVATTWFISFSQILEQDPLAARYLEFMSIFAEKDIPKSLLPPSKRLEATEAIGTLKAYAFITQREGPVEDSFDIHRLVRLAMRNWLEKEGLLKECISSTIQHLDEVFPYPYTTNKDMWMKYLPHAQVALESANLSRKPVEADVLTKVAEANSVLAQYQTAEQMYRQALEIRRTLLGEENPETITSINNLALILSYMGKNKEAEGLARSTIETYEKVLGKNHPSTITGRNNLALYIFNLGRNKEAEEIYRQTLRRSKKALGEKHASTITSLGSLAVILSESGRYKEAEKMQRRSYELHQETLGDNNFFTITSLNNLATTISYLGRYEEAEQLHKQALERSTGSGHISG
ncbi:kinesin light chain [Trichoderma arundinaceum]|uniref:Kinesin light chain n=1 Tax=Trichoderma arundinaceum TaxID=490622 RepID=A0A395NCL5_TRIAR|nr:kinesin light chain [Trichoderma arundinaceum]